MALGMMSCLHKVEENIPPEKVMHFPLMLAKNGPNVAVAGSSTDEKYDYSRIAILDRAALYREVTDKNASKKPILWDKVVKSNFLITPEVSPLSYTDSYLLVPNRKSNEIVVVAVKDDAVLCEKSQEYLNRCGSARSISLQHVDPFSMARLQSDAKKQVYAVSYLSSDHVDILRIDAAHNKPLQIVKSFRAHDWLAQIVESKILKGRRLITRKVVVTHENDLTQSKSYFLLEAYPKDADTPTNAKASFLVSLDTKRLLEDSSIKKENITLLDLKAQFSVKKVQDIYVDEDTSRAVILSAVPEQLLQIDLTDNSMLAHKTLCTGATSMAVNKTKNLIVVPCFTEGRVASFSLSSLDLRAVSEVVGRGPSHALIDDQNELILCTFSVGGMLVVFDLNFNYLGHVFDKAPSSRDGS